MKPSNFGNRKEIGEPTVITRSNITDSRADDSTDNRKEKREKIYTDIDKPSLITLEDAQRMAENAAEKATEKTLAKIKEERNNEEAGAMISGKTVKELQNIAGVFNALKEFSANPLQNAIEKKVGDVAAGVVEKAFSPPSNPEQKKDLLDQILNSQFAAGLGAGIGQRGPELVNTLTQNFGKDKTETWIDGMVTGKSRSGALPGGALPGMTQGGQSEMEMVLSLDQNNPEHVAAYAQSQGGMSTETARRVLRIHQDDFIKQMSSRGVDVTQYTMKRNYSPNPENVQEYRPLPSQLSRPGIQPEGTRVSDELMSNTLSPMDGEIKITGNPLERAPGPSIADIGKTDDTNSSKVVPYHPIQTNESTTTPTPENLSNISENLGENQDDMVSYLKRLEGIIQDQNNTISTLTHELEIFKKNNKDDLTPGDGPVDSTNIEPAKTVKKGFSYVKSVDANIDIEKKDEKKVEKKDTNIINVEKKDINIDKKEKDKKDKKDKEK